MFHDAPVYLAGYVATETKFRKVAGDISSAKLRVAYTARRRDRETGEWSDGPTSFVSVQCWRGLADNVRLCVRKGEPVLVMGRLQISRFEDGEGNPRTAVEIEATSIGHDALGRMRPRGRRCRGCRGSDLPRRRLLESRRRT